MTDPMSAPYIAPHSGYAIARTYVRTNERDGRYQDLGEKTQVPSAAGPVDFGCSRSEDMSYAEGAVLIARTKRVLDAMQREQVQLGIALTAAGPMSFADAADWLAAHANPLDQLAAELKAAALDGWHPSHERLGMGSPVPRQMPRYTPTPRELEIALAVLDRQEKADAA